MAGKLTQIQKMIYEIRGQKVMLDSDLAVLYGVEVKVFNQTVKRNSKRFPLEFMFQLTDEEWKNLRSQIVTFSEDARKYKPYAFTEHGILMLGRTSRQATRFFVVKEIYYTGGDTPAFQSSVLNTDKAIKINIEIMKIFVQMRQYVLSQSSTNEQIAELRKLLMLYIEKNDKRVNEIIIALNNLIEQPKKTKTIGFCTGEKNN